MRPDAVSWQNTRNLSALEFTPRKLTYHRVSRWFMIAVAAQAALTVLIWSILQGTAGRSMGISVPDAAAARPTFHQSLVRGLMSYQFLLIVIAQTCALLVVEVCFVARFRIFLRKQVAGLSSLFQGIRDMACGVMPKPLIAGLTGEVGYLTLAFNDMVGRVAASKQALMEANQLLERRVQERTRELTEALQKMELMASTDALTGLYNRRCLTHEFREAFDGARDRNTEIICVAIDLDGFKGVNDVLGHQTGDDIIWLAAEVLRKNTRACDLVARLGGDEFLVMMTQIDLPTALAAAQRLQTEFQRQARERLAKHEHELQRMPSMSIGVASREQTQPRTLEEMISQADAALYLAKEKGKARVETFVKQAA